MSAPVGSSKYAFIGPFRYVKERKARDLDECLIKIQQVEDEVAEATSNLEASRMVIKKAEREISESNATFANIRDNRRVRKLQKEIVDIQAKIEACDVEEAARAKRNYESQWAKRNAEEERLNNRVSFPAHAVGSRRYLMCAPVCAFSKVHCRES